MISSETFDKWLIGKSLFKMCPELIDEPRTYLSADKGSVKIVCQLMDVYFIDTLPGNNPKVRLLQERGALAWIINYIPTVPFGHIMHKDLGLIDEKEGWYRSEYTFRWN